MSPALNLHLLNNRVPLVGSHHLPNFEGKKPKATTKMTAGGTNNIMHDVATGQRATFLLTWKFLSLPQEISILDERKILLFVLFNYFTQTDRTKHYYLLSEHWL